MKKIISIAIPFFNKSKYFNRLLQSVYNAIKVNDFPKEKLEIIIVNDGSSEAEKNILHQMIFGTDLNIVVIDKINGGVSSARNHAIKNSTGELIYFLDADDIVLPGLLNLNELERLIVSKDAICLFGHLRIKNKQVKHKQQQSEIIVDDNTFNDLFISRNIHLSCILFNRNNISHLEFDENFNNAEDILFIFQAIRNKKVLFSNLGFGVYFYDGKFHSSNKSAYHSLVDMKGVDAELLQSFYKAYNERKFLSHSFFRENVAFDIELISVKFRILGLFRSGLVYMLVQKIRFLLF